jgi:radial spoke head protein 9
VQDYLIAEGGNEPQLTLQGNVHTDRKYFYSQDGAKWVDLQAIDAQTTERASTISTILVGDVAKQYEVADPAAPSPAEGEDAPKGFVVPELAVLRARVDAINAACGVEPAGSTVTNGQNKVVPNRLFAGLSYPEKLESYVHRDLSKTLANDLRGTWSVHYDPFKQQAVVRSLVFLGYAMYYNGADNAWGALYHGFGLRNSDLIFML